MIDALDPLRLPLRGSRLIEASAGTGKTWTIAALYLRLVLGHGGADAAAAGPLLPEQILVMTFTRAATRELADRIRSRLVEAAACFRGERDPTPDDAFLRALLDGYPDAAQRRNAAWRLALAAQAMDDAAVFTIDAWCQRMLREHAFDSGGLFDAEVLTDESVITAQAVRDFWRQDIVPLDAEALDGVLQVWKDPVALQRDVLGLHRHVRPEPGPAGGLGPLWHRLAEERLAALAAIKSGWVERLRSMRGWLADRLDDPQSPFSKTKLKPDAVAGWFDRLDTWARTPSQPDPGLDDKHWDRLSPAGLIDACRKAQSVDVPADFAALEQLRADLAVVPDPAPALRRFAAARVAARLQELKQAAATFGFHDLLERLEAALAGPAGPRLRARIVAQYPVALIDEFQDTSALQYAVFDRLYDIAADQPGDRAILLIGDPKQSIYAFRGADIASYLRARTATTGRHAMLATNHRATAALVGAVNRLFQRAEERPGEGAFRFRTADADPVPFIPVGARGRLETLVCAEGPIAAVEFALDPELHAGEAARERFADYCAARIVALLGDASAGFRQPDGGFERLRPADIAVLVRTGVEADAVRAALRERGVASAYLSDRESVFAGDEARDLVHWLRAVAEPANGRLARAAYATGTIGLSLGEVAALATDDTVYERRTALLHDLHDIWRRQGVLPMLRQTLYRLDLPARWLGQAGGERHLTNLLHLAELLQAASARLDGEQALVRWLVEQRGDGAAEADDRIVRLESDADLVKVVTIHKSKGLEYPVVFLPFATAVSGADRNGGVLAVADTAGEVVLEFAPTAQQREAAELARMQEDLRLLYVALTRARHALWVGVAALKVGRADACQFHRSALGYLLGGADPRPAGEIGPLVTAAFAGIDAVHLSSAGEPAARTRLAVAGSPPLLPARIYAGRFDRDWSIGSFSALVRGLAPVPSLPGAGAALQEELWEAAPIQGVATQDAPWHRFPRGALAGRFIHEQLAWLAEHGFDLTGQVELQQALAQRCARRGWAQHADDARRWLEEIIATPLPPLGATLRDVARPLAEMEFWLPAAAGRAAELDALCRHWLPGDPDRPPLAERRLRGMLMGYCDLVFEHDGRYWILDFKSNVLGAGDGDYDRAAIEAAVAEYRYDVQSALYLLALHRLLRSRLGTGYDPAHQLGGAIDLFLRGIHGPQAGCHVVTADGRFLDALDRLLDSEAEARS